MDPVILTPPLSKSDAQRALVLADILGVPFESVIPPGEELPRDVKVLRSGLEVLRTGGDLDCHDGGAPFRFLVTQAALSVGRTTRFTGTPRLGERPHGPLLAALNSALGPGCIEQGTPWPVLVRAPSSLQGLTGFDVTGVESSQFASSLLLGAARVCMATGQPCEVRVHGALASLGYLDLTRAWLERAGFPVTGDPSCMRVTRGPVSGRLEVPGDWSSLTYLLALAWHSGLGVGRVDFSAAHPDAEFVRHLESIGLEVSRGATVHVTGRALRGFEVDASRCPDAVPTLAAMAVLLPGPTVVTHTGILRHKESDRLTAVRDLVSAIGATTQLDDERLVITPTARPHEVTFDARDDHRLAMSAAVMAHLCGVRLKLTGAEAVAKSFPGFWREAAKAGVPHG